MFSPKLNAQITAAFAAIVSASIFIGASVGPATSTASKFFA